MAKVGFWLRGASGKLAGATHYKAKSGTVSREIVTPANPRTKRQVAQRTKFAAAVRFYKVATEGLYQFAFERKATSESDYNAFMRFNTSRAIAMSSEAIEQGMMALGENFVVADGTLPAPDVQWTDADSGQSLPFVALKGMTADVLSIADASQCLINNGYCIPGDIVTILTYSQDVKRDYTPYFDVQQFIVDTADERYFEETTAPHLASGNNVLYLGDDSFMLAPTAVAFIISRQTPSGLKVSHSEMIGNEYWLGLIQEYTSKDGQDAIIDSYDHAEESILEGSIADNYGHEGSFVNKSVSDGIILEGATELQTPMVSTGFEFAQPFNETTKMVLQVSSPNETVTVKSTYTTKEKKGYLTLYPDTEDTKIFFYRASLKIGIERLSNHEINVFSTGTTGAKYNLDVKLLYYEQSGKVVYRANS